MKTEINFATSSDKQFWFTLDRHLSEEEYDNKIRDRRCYVLSVDGKKAGILRYNLFWDNGNKHILRKPTKSTGLYSVKLLNMISWLIQEI